jgi:hypothetical protein
MENKKYKIENINPKNLVRGFDLYFFKMGFSFYFRRIGTDSFLFIF